MLVVLDLDGRIDAAAHRHVEDFAAPTRDAQREILLGLEAGIEAQHVVDLPAI